jgi:4-amino-4-deoxy-L-arabinose transferase-like glycosyltransferase
VPFVCALMAGLLLRVWWVYAHPALSGDPQVYADIARNWLVHGVYGVTNGTVRPTLIRLPGYPLFLAICFKLFGLQNVRAVLLVQVLADLGTCVLLAATTRRLWSRRAGMVTLWLAALCPFTATYSAALLTETLELFTIAAALLVFAQVVGADGVRGRGGSDGAQVFSLRDARSWRFVVLLALPWSYAALLRPDGALLAVTLCPAVVLYTRGRAWRLTLAAGLLSVVPFVPWTIRNWHTFHVFEPLAPRYATDPGEPTHPGFQRWTKTVCVDFTCTQEIYWNLDSDAMDFGSLPARAFDTPAEYAATRQLFAEYNKTTTLTDAEDAEFARLAAERIKTHPWRYYLLLPAARVADMWLRPRLELLPNDLRWWQYGEHPGETKVAYAAAGINLAYLLLAISGAGRRPPLLGAMLVFLLLRSLLLATIEAPEQRYTLECLTVVFILAGVGLGGRRTGFAEGGESIRLKLLSQRSS